MTGGFDLASQWMGWENVFQVENNKWCKKVLKKNFPNVKRYGDIKKFNGTKYKGAVDIISGGFPCQPFSQAGKRKGTEDDRYLWPQMLRIISEVKPAWIVGENVAGLHSMENGRTLERILIDLEGEGYWVETYIIPACAIEAWHRRERIWIFAHTFKQRLQNNSQFKKSKVGISKPRPSNNFGGHLSVNWDDRYRNGGDIRRGVRVSKRLDRIKGLGNGLIPQVAYELFKAIEENN